LSVESSVGVGTTFTIVLPVRAKEPPTDCRIPGRGEESKNPEAKVEK
jgi:hypothetical protein